MNRLRGKLGRGVDEELGLMEVVDGKVLAVNLPDLLCELARGENPMGPTSHRGAASKHLELDDNRNVIRSMSVAALWMAIQFLRLFKDRKSIVLGVWAASGAPETLAKGGGRSPPSFGRVSGAGQTPKMTDFRPRKKYLGT